MRTTYNYTLWYCTYNYTYKKFWRLFIRITTDNGRGPVQPFGQSIWLKTMILRYTARWFWTRAAGDRWLLTILGDPDRECANFRHYWLQSRVYTDRIEAVARYRHRLLSDDGTNHDLIRSLVIAEVFKMCRTDLFVDRCEANVRFASIDRRHCYDDAVMTTPVIKITDVFPINDLDHQSVIILIKTTNVLLIRDLRPTGHCVLVVVE